MSRLQTSSKLGLKLKLSKVGFDAKYANAIVVLSNSSVAESAIVGATVGSLSVLKGRGTYVFTLTSDTDDKFVISGSSLNLKNTVDFETKTSHSVTVRASNGIDHFIERDFSITVTNVAE
ncbi:hypothetical protein PP939_gp014 [Rhizobium phage RL38J1]|uniref:Cadherin domain-containing protein n=1 Tax=Rhizobium phage RL38J1 TaxID=2663232 RepID=A0A6B9J5G0_9CAUD|nr:hypothetical protein PP939_gp014 [Rhizobium phage RL38J1]QGZ13965.1 hypothetical protein RL38J1_014 [Rhizobium phage RL38J1]